MKTPKELEELHAYMTLALHGNEEEQIAPVEMTADNRLMFYSIKTTLCWILGCGGAGVETLNKNFGVIKDYYASRGIARMDSAREHGEDHNENA